MAGTKPEVAGRGVLSAAISNAMVVLLHRYTGRGPTKARTTIGEDLIVCVLGATLTKGEQSLVQDGKHEVVLHSRRAFQDTMRVEAIAAVEELSGRRVVAFMSNNHIDPDLAVEVFVLAPEAGDATEEPGPWLDNHRSQIVDHGRDAQDDYNHRSRIVDHGRDGQGDHRSQIVDHGRNGHDGRDGEHGRR